MMRTGLLLLSFLVAPFAKADMATNYWLRSDEIWLIYVQDGNLVRADCDETRLIYNRSTCPTRVATAEFALFAERLRAKFEAPLAGIEQQAGDLTARIDEIDLELLTILNTEPDPVDPTLKDQIAAKETEVDDAAAALIPLQDQIARILDELRTRESPDLRRQLITLQGQLDEGKAALSGLRVELAALRQRFIEANAGAFEPRRYRTLQNERDLRVDQLSEVKRNLDYTMEHLIAVSQALQDILQGSFTTNYLSGTGDPGPIRLVINAFHEFVEPLDPVNRTFQAKREDGGRALIIDVPGQAKLETFVCDLISECPAGPSSYSAVQGPLFHRQILGYHLSANATGASDRLLEPMSTGNVGGRWRIYTPYCTGYVDTRRCYITVEP